MKLLALASLALLAPLAAVPTAAAECVDVTVPDGNDLSGTWAHLCSDAGECAWAPFLAACPGSTSRETCVSTIFTFACGGDYVDNGEDCAAPDGHEEGTGVSVVAAYPRAQVLLYDYCREGYQQQGGYASVNLLIASGTVALYEDDARACNAYLAVFSPAAFLWRNQDCGPVGPPNAGWGHLLP